MEERGRVTGGGAAGCGLGGCGGVWAAAGPAGAGGGGGWGGVWAGAVPAGAAAARATVLRNLRRPVGGVIWCECSMFGGWRRLILGRLRFWPNKAKREDGAKVGEWGRELGCLAWGHFGRADR